MAAGERGLMQRVIVGFDQDELGDWRAILACGHRQHVRHNPPFVNRPWVLTEEGRNRFLGAPLECKACDEGEPVGDGAVSAGALEVCYDRFREELHSYLLRAITEPDTVEDALRDTFLAIHDHVGSLDEGDRLEDQVDLAVRGAVPDLGHRAQSQTANAARSLPEEGGGAGVATAATRWIRALWDCLPGIYRQALLLNADKGLGPDEIGKWLDISPAEAGARLRIGRAMLREALLDCCHVELDRLGLTPRYQPRCATCATG